MESLTHLEVAQLRNRVTAIRGCKTLDGLGMLVNQGVIGFKIRAGVNPDPGVMREAFEEYLEL